MTDPKNDAPPAGQGPRAQVAQTIEGGLHEKSNRPDVQTSSLLLRWKLVCFALTDSRLSKTDIAVLAFILARIGETGTAWPGLSTIAADGKVTRRSASRSVGQLVKFGYIKRDSGTRTTSNTYRMGERAREVDFYLPKNGRDKPVSRDELVPTGRDETVPRGRDKPVPGVGTSLSTVVGTSLSPELVQLNSSNEQEDQNQKKRTQKARAGDRDQTNDLIALDLPEGLTRENWTAYVEHRAAMPKAKRLTATSAAMCLRKLKTWAAQGHDANDIVCASIANGWQGLFEPKGPPATKPPGRVSVPSQQQAADINTKAAARMSRLGSVAASFEDAVYTGTADEDLPPHLREGISP